MKLKLEHEFELTVSETTYKGLLRDLTKKEVKSINKLSPRAEIKELKKIEDRTSKRAIELEDIIDNFDTENIYQKRLSLSIMGDDKDAIMAVGEEYGYNRVFDTIIEDIAQRREGN